MAGAMERIERDLIALEQAIAEIAKQLYGNYSNYLDALGQAVRQQLILSTYHLCTQGYPSQFLNLSFSQRQQLQQSLRQSAEQAKISLMAHLQATIESEDKPEAAEASAGDRLEAEQEESEIIDFPNHPKALLDWQEQIEAAIAKTLQGISRDSNRLLQKAGILPKKLPEALLEAASKVEAATENVASPPNLLNLVIETESDAELQNSTITHIIAIHLRLSEIEFADPNVMSLRHQIRSLVARLNTMEREYQKKQRERAVAEAEAAWRSSWFDE